MSPLTRHVLFGRKGRLIGDTDHLRTLIEKYGIALGGTIRADLIDLLARPLKASLSLHYDREVVGVDTENPDRVTAHLADGSSLTADLLVGADGIGSTVAKLVFGTVNDQPRYSGENIFYGVIDDLTEPFKTSYLGKPNTLVQLFDRGEFICFPVGGPKKVRRGCSLSVHCILWWVVMVVEKMRVVVVIVSCGCGCGCGRGC